MATLDVAIVGCGHMGSRHARVVARTPGCRVVASVDLIRERAERVAAECGGEVRSDVPDGAHVVIVATPTTTHIGIARPHVDDGRWCLVEKPVAESASAAAELVGPRVGVGHLERFNPAVRASKPLAPRFVSARRMGPPTGRGLDVDVIMDLMIHDLDLVLAWSEGEVTILDAIGVAVRGPLVDTASVRLRTACGLTASLTASRVAPTPERRVTVYEKGRYMALDLLAGRAWGPDGPVRTGDGRDALTAQWEAFVAAVRGHAPLPVDGEAGQRAVALAERIGARVAG